jgi:hypothetical protein
MAPGPSSSLIAPRPSLESFGKDLVGGALEFLSAVDDNVKFRIDLHGRKVLVENGPFLPAGAGLVAYQAEQLLLPIGYSTVTLLARLRG